MGKNKVNDTSAAYQRMAPRWAKLNALLGGTEAMRNAGKVYLPQYETESEQAYKVRLGRTVLFNVFRKAVTTLVGKPFGKPVKLGDAFPPELEKLVDDVDQLGNDLTAFSRVWFEDALVKSFSGVLVDYTKVDPEAVKTKADEEAAHARPYFVHLPAECILAVYTATIDGVEAIVHIRIKETQVTRTEFDEQVVEQVRVWEPDQWQLWECRSGKKWTLVDDGVNTLGVVPVVLFYAHRDGTGEGTPPLMDLAEKNIEHWQSSSDQRNVLTVTRFPILAGSGIADADKLVIGPNNMLTTEKDGSKIYYVEHNGAAIKAGHEDLTHIEDQMAALSVELMIRKTGDVTATEKGISTSHTKSDLEKMVEGFTDALERAFSYAAKWMKVTPADDAIKIDVHNDWSIDGADQSGGELLKDARTRRDISRDAYLTELKRRNILAPSYDADADQDLIDAEPPPLALPTKPGAPGQPPVKPGQPAPKPGQPAPKPTTK